MLKDQITRSPELFTMVPTGFCVGMIIVASAMTIEERLPTLHGRFLTPLSLSKVTKKLRTGEGHRY